MNEKLPIYMRIYMSVRPACSEGRHKKEKEEIFPSSA